MVALKRLDANAAWAEMAHAIEQDGAVIVEGFLTPAFLDQLNGELDSIIESEPPGSTSVVQRRQAFHGERTKRACGLAARSPAFVELMLHPGLECYADHFLLTHADEYWLNTGQLMVVGGGEPAQVIHRDEGNWPYFAERSIEVTVSAMFALEDFTAENGATQVVPGSQGWTDLEREPTDDEITQAVMPAGSALLYLGTVLHGAGENRSRGWRRGLHVSFVLAWLRPEEHHYLHVPEAAARTLPARAQQLLGYTTYVPSAGGRLGLVDFQEVGAKKAP